MVKTRAAKRMEKKAEEQRRLLEKLLSRKNQPADVSWRRASRRFQSRLEISPTTSAGPTPPNEL